MRYYLTAKCINARTRWRIGALVDGIAFAFAGGASVSYYSIPAAQEAGLGDFSKLPAALKVVLENMLRFEDGKTVTVDDIKAFAEWGTNGGQTPREIAYRPARVSVGATEHV